MQLARELFGLEEGVDATGSDAVGAEPADVRPLRRRDAQP
jgi:hypothetical protein